MQITFKTLKMKNFMSFKSGEVDFDKSGYTIVSGINLNKDDNAVSNGAGKSTCFEAIVWALTGETIRGTTDVKTFGVKEKCEVTLTFDIDGTNYIITRTKDPSNLFLFVNGEDKSGKGIRDTALIVKQYLPDLTAQLIGSVIIMGQGLPQRFSNNSPSGRKDVLEKLSKSDFMIEDLKDKVTKRKIELATKKREVEDTILAASTSITNANNLISKYTAELNTLNSINYDTLIIEKQNIFDSYTKNSDELKNQLSNLTEAINQRKTEYSKIADSKYTDTIIITKKYEPLIAEQTKLYAQASSDEAVLKNQINSIKNIKTHCPTCGQPLKGVTKPDPAPLIEELNTKSAITKEISARATKLNSDKQVELAEVQKKYSASETEIQTKINELQKQYNLLNSQLNQVTSFINITNNELNNILLQKQNHTYKVEQLTTSINDANSNITDNQSKIDTANIELDSIKLHTDVITKFENALKRDFRGILLNNIIKYIDSRAKEYSKIVFNTDKIGFTLDGNNISITYCGKDYSNLSGGEKQRVDLIVQFALRDMLCKYLNFSSNILVLDEIVDNLDSMGCQKVMELISMKLNDVTGIYIISHHSDIQMPCDHELKIIKDTEGISSVGNN